MTLLEKRQWKKLQPWIESQYTYVQKRIVSRTTLGDTSVVNKLFYLTFLQRLRMCSPSLKVEVSILFIDCIFFHADVLGIWH